MTEVSGLTIIADAISAEQERWLVEWIDRHAWSSALARRTQHYGWRYSYDRRELSAADHLGELPLALRKLLRHLQPLLPTVVTAALDQAIVNEYRRGQRISAHIDHHRNFGATIVTLSLLSVAQMRFARAGTSIDVELAPRSIAVMSGEARWSWAHEILPVQDRRISVTYRQAVLRQAEAPAKVAEFTGTIAGRRAPWNRDPLPVGASLLDEVGLRIRPHADEKEAS